jgi:hypothetical protein
MECFDHPHLFLTVDCRVYGKREAVRMMSLPLRWKPLGDRLVFIFAITSRGPIVLMGSELTLSPTTAIELYCVRTRIEILFDGMKNCLGAFRFHFWTKKLPRHARRPTANRRLKAPSVQHLPPPSQPVGKRMKSSSCVPPSPTVCCSSSPFTSAPRCGNATPSIFAPDRVRCRRKTPSDRCSLPS